MLLTALGLTAVTSAARGDPHAAAVPQGALQTCASLAADADRLACYDRLAGRSVPGAAAQAASASATATAPPAVPLPAVAASSAAPAPPPAEAFGLYEAEHPKPPVAAAASLEARVTALGASGSGRVTVSLEGGAVWELDGPDPLLAVGETVTVARAAFGSYIMHTPSHRTHRVRRLH
jgi:hypothetical protein